MGFLREFFGFGRNKRVSKREDHPDVYRVSSTSEQMAWATEKAKLTLHYFKTSLVKPTIAQTYFSLKAKIQDGNEIEHIWLNDVSFDDADIYYGTIGNEPLIIRNISLGTKVGIDHDSVSDWMIIEGGRLIGGYTIRCLRDAMPEKEQKAFDKTLGFQIDEGVDHFKHDPSTPEGAILSIEDAYTAQDLQKVIKHKDFELEASFMLSQNKDLQNISKDATIIAETAKTFKVTFERLLEEQGFPNFEAVQRAFPKREFVNADVCIVTEVCHYPDNTKSIERIYCGRRNNRWFVMNPAD